MLNAKGHKSRIFIDVRGNNAFEEVVGYNPDVVGVSCTTGLHHWGTDFLRRIKSALPNVLTLLGGPHATFCPETAMEEGVDFAVRGEAENAVVDIAEAVDNGGEIEYIENVAYARNEELIINPMGSLIENLDSLPFPDRSYYDHYPLTRREGSKNFIAGRGCPYKCTFCANFEYHNIYRDKGKWVRYRSHENVLEEIRQVRERYGIKFVGFSDDTLIFNRKWLLPFLEKYRAEIGLPFLSTVRANLIDEEIVRALKEAGCISCVFGVESGVERIRNDVLQKGIRDEEIRETAALFKKYKIQFGTYNMLGLPSETIEDSWQTVKLNAEIRPDFPWCSILQPYPGTKIHSDMEQSLGKSIDPNDIQASYFTASVIDNSDIRQMENLQKFFHLAVRVPWLQPIIKKLIKLPPNFLFTLVFQICYGWQLLRRSHLNVLQMFRYWWTQQSIFNRRNKDSTAATKVSEEVY